MSVGQEMTELHVCLFHCLWTIELRETRPVVRGRLAFDVAEHARLSL